MHRVLNAVLVTTLNPETDCGYACGFFAGQVLMVVTKKREAAIGWIQLGTKGMM
jgi:hypothetical protein